MVLAPPTSRLAVLLFTDIVGSTDLKSRLGTGLYVRLLARHDALFRECVVRCPGAEIVSDSGDGYFAVFPTVGDAVRAALRFQHGLHREPWDTAAGLRTRVGIHVGEITEVGPDDGGDGPRKFVGVSADCAARVMSLAAGGQILLTREAFDGARQSVHEHPPVNGQPAPPLKWVAHGEYLFSGIDQPVEVFEVGADGVAPFAPPKGGDKARRSVSAEQEETLGWRPAVGLAVPQRPGWVLERKLGEGTFGEVWLARLHEGDEPGQSRVFKFCFDAERLRSFKREFMFFQLIRDALGDRDDIARLSGVRLEEPPFYLESEHAPGGNLIDWAAAQGGLAGVPMEVRLDIVARVAGAVAAAHSAGILHKDIKPGNVLIHFGPDRQPRPQLSDFGIGLLMDHARLPVGHRAAHGAVTLASKHSGDSGTRLYSPPESLSGRPFTTHGDVYALGVLLFQMVVGDLSRPVSEGWERDVTDELLREDIAACIEGTPSRRLSNAAEVELRLRSLPERRRRRADERRANQSAQRRARLLRAGTVVGLLLVVAGAFAALAYVREHGLRVRAEASDRRAQLAYAGGAVDQGAALHLAGRGVASRDAFLRARTALAAVGESTLPADVGLGRSFREFQAPINTLQGHDDGLMSVAWFPDGVHACSASQDGTIRIWDARTGVTRRVLRGHTGDVMAVAVSRDGRFILSGGEDRTVRLWKAATGSEVRSYVDPDGAIRCVAFSPDGKRALFGPFSLTGVVRLWDVETGRIVSLFDMGSKEHVAAVAFDATGERVLATTYLYNVWIWDVSTGRLLHRLSKHAGYVMSASFSADGRYVASGSFDKAVNLWDAQAGALVRTFTGHTAGVRGVAFTWADEVIVSGAMDGILRVWDVAKGELFQAFAGHRDGIRGIAVSRDGRRALTASIDRTAKVWALTRSAELPTVTEPALVTALGVSADGTMFVTGDATGAVRLRDAATRHLLREYPGHVRPIDVVAMPADGRRIVAGDSAGAVLVWDVSTGARVAALPGVGPGEADFPRAGKWCFTAVAPDGSVVATTGQDTTIKVRDLATGATLRSLGPMSKELASVAISPDSRTLVGGDGAGEVVQWELSSGRRVWTRTTGPKPGKVDSVAFSSDGRFVLTGGHDPTVRRWDATTGNPAGEYPGATLMLKAVASAGGGRTVVAMGGEQALRMWDAASGRELEVGVNLYRHGFGLAVLPPGDVVLVSGGPEVTCLDTSRATRHVEFGDRVDAACASLRANPGDAKALAVLGEWYAFRGTDDWAADLLEGARAAGEPVRALTLARCHWQRELFADAAREFRRARAAGEAPVTYLDLCIAATEASAATRPTKAASGPVLAGERRP